MAFISVPPPFLPQAGATYDQRLQNTFADVLRLYFNRLNGDLSALGDFLGGSLLSVPTALYYSTTQQTAAAIDTAYQVEFENTYFESGMAINGASNTQITVAKPGIYNFQLSGQLFSNSSSPKTLQIWITKNGTDIGYSGHAYTIAANTAYEEVNWNFNIDLGADEYIEFSWATDDTDLYFDPLAPSAPYPGISSAVLAVNFVSSLDGIDIAAAP